MGAGGRGDKHHILFGNRSKFPKEGPNALCITLCRFIDERKLLNIRKGFDIRRLHTGFVKGPLVVRRMVIGKLYNFL